MFLWSFCGVRVLAVVGLVQRLGTERYLPYHSEADFGNPFPDYM